MSPNLRPKKNRSTSVTRCEAPKYTTSMIPARGNGGNFRSLNQRSQWCFGRKFQNSSLNWYIWVMTKWRRAWTVSVHLRVTRPWQRASSSCSTSRIWNSSIRQTSSSTARNLNSSPIWLCSSGIALNGGNSKPQSWQTNKARGKWKT